MIENAITTKATALFGVVDGINQMLIDWGVSPVLAGWLDEIISVTLLFIIAYITDLIGRYIIHRVIGRIAKYTKNASNKNIEGFF